MGYYLEWWCALAALMLGKMERRLAGWAAARLPTRNEVGINYTKSNPR